MRLETAASVIPHRIARRFRLGHRGLGQIRLGIDDNPIDKKVDPWTTPPPK